MTFSLQHTNSSVLEEKLNKLSTIHRSGRVNVTSVNTTDANVTLFRILFAFVDPRGVEMINGTSSDNRTLVLNIRRARQGRCAKNFRFVVGNTPSEALTPSDSIADINKVLRDWFSQKCETPSRGKNGFGESYN